MKSLLPPFLASLIFFTIFFTAALPVIAATYVVQSGDTLYAIASRHGTTVDALKAANGLTSNVIWVGQTLQIGSSSPQTPTGAYHTVVRGDTLYSLARRYGTTVDAIMRANRLTSPNIYIGQRLTISSSPTPPVGSTTYTVVRGDTLYSIARRYGTTVDAMKALNNISGRFIYIGQLLRIPQTATFPTVTPIGTPTVGSTPTAIATPTITVTQTPTTTPTSANIIIQSINYNGVVPVVESDEYAIITNVGGATQSIGGWRLEAGDGEDFVFPSFDLMPNQVCRVYTNEDHPEYCGFNFGSSTAIWNNTEHATVALYTTPATPW